MTFEYRTIESDLGYLLGVLVDGNRFHSLSISSNIKGLEDFYIDGEHYIKYTLYTGLWKKLTDRDNELTDKEKNAIKDFKGKRLKLEIYEMLCKAEALGWLEYIKDTDK